MDEELIKAEYDLQKTENLPQGVTVGEYTDRRDLQQAMERLDAAGFPMQTLFIVNSGMRQVDFPMGKLSYPRVALSAALSGIFFGLVFAAIVGLATGGSMLAAAISYVPLAVAFTVIYSVLNFSRQKKQTNAGYMMRSVMIPAKIELKALPVTAAQASQILGPAVSRTAPSAPATPKAPEFFLPQQSAGESQPGENPSAVRRADKPAAQNFGKLIEDPEEYRAAIRQEPERPSTNERVEEIRAQQSAGRYGKRVESQEEFEQTVRRPEDDAS